MPGQAVEGMRLARQREHQIAADGRLAAARVPEEHHQPVLWVRDDVEHAAPGRVAIAVARVPHPLEFEPGWQVRFIEFAVGVKNVPQPDRQLDVGHVLHRVRFDEDGAESDRRVVGVSRRTQRVRLDPPVASTEPVEVVEQQYRICGAVTPNIAATALRPRTPDPWTCGRTWPSGRGRGRRGTPRPVPDCRPFPTAASARPHAPGKPVPVSGCATPGGTPTPRRSDVRPEGWTRSATRRSRRTGRTPRRRSDSDEAADDARRHRPPLRWPRSPVGAEHRGRRRGGPSGRGGSTTRRRGGGCHTRTTRCRVSHRAVQPVPRAVANPKWPV